MSTSETQSAWFLAQLKPNAYQIAERHLARQGFCSFLPLEEKTLRRRGRFSTPLKPLFPGYIFVKFNADLGGWRAINSTQGITRLVGFGAGPTPVPEGLVSTLMARCDARGKVQPAPALPPGSKVRVATVPFAEFVATVDQVAPDRRVWVLLDLMGRQTRATMPSDQLMALET